MSYLTLPAGIPNFSKAVISLWFRAPRESVIKASASAIGDENFPLMQRILPLVTFGMPQNLKTYLTPTRNVAAIHPYTASDPGPSTTYNTIYYDEGPSYEVDPTFIGLKCFSDGSFTIVIHIQTHASMSFAATSFITTKMHIWSGADPAAPVAVLGNGVVSLFPKVGLAIIEDVSYVNAAQPEYFTVQSNDYQPDHWHHLLLSFDISGEVSIGTPFASSSCRLWYAIDDVDYRGAENLRPYRDFEGQWGHDNLDPNAIITKNAWAYSGSDPDWEAIHYYQNHFVGLPSGTLRNASIPSGQAHMGFPAASRYVESIVRVEMAEFQMWTGVTLDTGNETNRRAFINAEGKPVKPKEAETLLGKRPIVLLHGSSSWKNGRNTGSSGKDDDGEIIEAGQFQRTAKIEAYKPEPSLHGPQDQQTPTA